MPGQPGPDTHRIGAADGHSTGLGDKRLTGSGDGRLIGLEVLRFVAAVGVLVWHYQHFAFQGPDGPDWDAQRLPFQRLFAPFYAYGHAGVSLFWCLSGFILTWKYRGVIGGKGISFGDFLWRRFSRLYPLHLATLLSVALLQAAYSALYGQSFVYLFNDTSHFLLNLLFAGWWGFQSGQSFNGPSWSVSAEVLIYMLFYRVARCAGRGWFIDLLAMAGFAIMPAVVMAVSGSKLSVTGAGLFFYIGALTLHGYRWIETLAPPARRSIAGMCGAAVIVGSVLVAWRVVAIAGASLVMFPALVLLVQLTIRPESRWWRSWLMGLGNLTYAGYMLHFPMQLALMLVFGGLAVPVRDLVYTDWFMLAYLGSVLAAAFAVFRFVERPVQTWLRGIRPSRTAPAGPFPAGIQD